MENEKVENKKAKNKEALRDLRKFTFDSAVQYFTASTEKERADVLANVYENLTNKDGLNLDVEEAGLIVNAFSSMGNAAGLSKKEMKENVNDLMFELSRIGLYNKEMYDEAAAKPEDKVKWRAADAVVDRFRLADLNFNRTSNGLGIALDKIVLSAESAGTSAGLGARKAARATSEALRGAANGFAAACSAARTKLAGYMQNRVMRRNIRINHDNAIITDFYEKSTINRLQEAIAREENADKKDKLNILLGYINENVVVETPYTMLWHDNALRYANMYLEGEPRAQDVSKGFIKFNSDNKENFTRSVKRKLAYAEAKKDRQEKFEEILNAYDNKRGVLKAKGLASKVYHARRSELKGQDLDAGNLNAAEYRAGVHETDKNQEYKRAVDRTVAVTPGILKRGAAKIKAFFSGTPSAEKPAPQETQGEVAPKVETEKKEGFWARYKAKRAQKKQERKMAKENAKKENEMEQNSVVTEEKKSSEKKSLRDRWFAWRADRAEKRAQKAEKRGDAEKAKQIREAQAKKEQARAKKLADKEQRRAEKQARKTQNNVKTEETKTTEAKTAEKKPGFWARYTERRAQKAERRGNFKAAQDIREKYAKKVALREGKKAAKVERNAAIRAAKEDYKKTVNSASSIFAQKVRSARETCRQKIASLRNEYRNIPRHWIISNLNKVETKEAPEKEVKQEKKPGWWTRFKNWIKGGKKEKGAEKTDVDPEVIITPAPEVEPVEPKADKETTGEATEDPAKVNEGAEQDGAEGAQGQDADKKPEEEEQEKPEEEFKFTGIVTKEFREADRKCQEAQEKVKEYEESEQIKTYLDTKAYAEKCREERRQAYEQMKANQIADAKKAAAEAAPAEVAAETQSETPVEVVKVEEQDRSL